MFLLFRNHGRRKSLLFNITPVIDIVFLLIIFFVLDFQFLGEDSRDIELPDKCSFAGENERIPNGAAVIVVSRSGEGELRCSVNNRLADTLDKIDLERQMTEMLDNYFADVLPEDRLVVLRIDKNLRFSDAQYAMAAASASTATGIKIATLAERNAD